MFELLPLLGRTLFALTFLGAGLGHFAQREALAEQTSTSPAAVLASGSLLLVGGTLVLLGLQARWGAALLAVFLVVVSFRVHRFWSIDDPVEASTQQAHFMKNLGLLGGTLLIMFFGPGPFSLGG